MPGGLPSGIFINPFLTEAQSFKRRQSCDGFLFYESLIEREDCLFPSFLLLLAQKNGGMVFRRPLSYGILVLLIPEPAKFLCVLAGHIVDYFLAVTRQAVPFVFVHDNKTGRAD